MNFLTKLFHKDEWPEGKNVKWIIQVKGEESRTIYLSGEELFVITTLINLGREVTEMPIVFANVEQKTTEEYIQ